MLFQIDPFPDPTHAGQEIEFIGFMFASILILMIMIIFMFYLYQKVRLFLPELVVFLFSLVIGVYSLSSAIPYTPWFQIFFILVQSVFLYLEIDRGDRFNKNRT